MFVCVLKVEQVRVVYIYLCVIFFFFFFLGGGGREIFTYNMLYDMLFYLQGT